ncbi:MAG: hypothetical protein V4724_16485 [Pseudomonadota bacterium]
MSRKTHEEYILAKHPQLEALSGFYRTIGTSNPVLCAEADLRGEPATLATQLFVHGLRGLVTPSTESRWADDVQSEDIADEQLRARAAECVQYLLAEGIDLARVTPLIQAIQTLTIGHVAGLLDEGPEISCLPMPEGRQTHWQLFEVNDDELPGAAITGLHENL